MNSFTFIMSASLEDTTMATGLEKVNPHLMPVPKKGSTKECTNHWTIALISYASKVMVKSCMLLLLLLLLSRFSRA